MRETFYFNNSCMGWINSNILQVSKIYGEKSYFSEGYCRLRSAVFLDNLHITERISFFIAQWLLWISFSTDNRTSYTRYDLFICSHSSSERLHPFRLDDLLLSISFILSLFFLVSLCLFLILFWELSFSLFRASQGKIPPRSTPPWIMPLGRLFMFITRSLTIIGTKKNLRA